MTDPDDQRLWSDLRAGRREAYAEVVRRHYKGVYRFLLHLTRDVHEAEDRTQETFTAAWQRIATFEGRASLGTWLHRIAYTKFIDARRAEQRKASSLGRLTAGPGSSPNPDEAAIADDEARRLYEALDGLEVADRTVLVLHYLQDLSYREMATVLGEPTGTVKWRTGEALKNLRTLLAEEVSDRAP